ncbi:uncharacterized protein BXIN_1879 [Babesia sp. Xinjiang]|uniref:uncharacterized protein n=1 Tax=Babesia sp. Xinjiang TaxID=462227 RepID=UPI000A22EA3F|nr:uncharacterized protein BXIN_1879 [Babesia sp. Xinjiang]ORM40374.1 hypothetical protein BXIN_1879 [Babesia sp. Xinjiang]
MEVHKTSFTVYDKVINVLSVEFDKGVYIWVGDESQVCKDLHCGFPFKNIQGEEVVGSTLIGDLDTLSCDLSKTFAKRFNTAVFMSYNIDENDSTMLSLLQEALIKALVDMYPQYAKN